MDVIHYSITIPYNKEVLFLVAPSEADLSQLYKLGLGLPAPEIMCNKRYPLYNLFPIKSISFIFPAIANSTANITLNAMEYANCLFINMQNTYAATTAISLNLALFLKTRFSHSSNILFIASIGDNIHITIDDIITMADISYTLNGIYIIAAITNKYITQEDI